MPVGETTGLEEEYLEARAETELSLAQSATHPAVVRAHYLMADLYLARLYGQDIGTAERSRNNDYQAEGQG